MRINLKGQPFQKFVHLEKRDASSQQYNHLSFGSGPFENGTTQKTGGDAMEVDRYGTS